MQQVDDKRVTPKEQHGSQSSDLFKISVPAHSRKIPIDRVANKDPDQYHSKPRENRKVVNRIESDWNESEPSQPRKGVCGLGHDYADDNYQDSQGKIGPTIRKQNVRCYDR